MTTASRVTAAALCLTAVLGVSSCSSADAPPEPTATTNSTQPEPAAPEPTEPATPEVVIPTEPGDLVPADQIDAAREAGVAVYVSPNGDGSGIVVGEGAYDPILADAEPIPGTVDGVETLRTQGEMLADIARATDDAGVGVILVFTAGTVSGDDFEPNGFTSVTNKTASGYDSFNGSKSQVLAAAEAYAAANPGTIVIDLTA